VDANGLTAPPLVGLRSDRLHLWSDFSSVPWTEVKPHIEY
jgi:hypothetical protein